MCLTLVQGLVQSFCHRPGDKNFRGLPSVMFHYIGLKSQKTFHEFTTVGLHPRDVALYHFVMPKVVLRPARPCQPRLMLIW
jgi:hypothetical protein